MVPAQRVSPVGEFNGDVRDLPQTTSREHPELELIEPQDYVNNDQPLKTPIALAGRPLGPMPALSANFSGMSYLDNYCVGGQCGNLASPFQVGAFGSTVSFTATVSAANTNTATIFLNSDSFNVEAPLSVDDTGFLTNFPLSMNPGDSVTNVLFTRVHSVHYAGRGLLRILPDPGRQ
jgi:hypothetical protein